MYLGEWRTEDEINVPIALSAFRDKREWREPCLLNNYVLIYVLSRQGSLPSPKYTPVPSALPIQVPMIQGSHCLSLEWVRLQLLPAVRTSSHQAYLFLPSLPSSFNFIFF